MSARPARFALTATDAVLIAWFGAMSIVVLVGPILKGDPIRYGWDAIVYAHAAAALLAGGNPWATDVLGVTFAAPPPSLILYLPFSALPDVIVGAAWVAIAAASAVYAVRRLRLPLWWLLFPPLTLGVAAGSSALPVLALLVRGGAAAEALAVLGRVYAVIPLAVLARWRGIALSVLALLVTAPFLAWGTFLADWPEVSATLVRQSGGGASATANPIVIPVAVLGLLLLGRRTSAWLLVPALWPNSQLYYASIALPVLARTPFSALAMATPFLPGLVAFGLAADGLTAWIRRARGRESAAPDPAVATER